MKKEFENSEIFKKAVAERIESLRTHFLISNPTKVVEESLKHAAIAGVWLDRYEWICTKLPAADAAHSYPFMQRDRADRQYRTRIASLQKLTGDKRAGQRRNQWPEVRHFFGTYLIKGEEFVHYRYIQSKPLSLLLFPKKPPSCCKKINGEYFLKLKMLDRFKAAADAKWERLSEDEQEALLQEVNREEAEVRYQRLPKEPWFALFQPRSKSTGSSIEFKDAVPSREVSEKAVRNAVDYRNRKTVRNHK